MIIIFNKQQIHFHGEQKLEKVKDKPMRVCLETKCRETTEPTVASRPEKPLKKGECKTETEAFEERRNLLPASIRMCEFIPTRTQPNKNGAI